MRRQKSKTSLKPPSLSRAPTIALDRAFADALDRRQAEANDLLLRPSAHLTEKSLLRLVDVGPQHLDAARAHLGDVLDDLVGVFLVAGQQRPP